MKDYIEMKAAGAAGVRTNKGSGEIERWRHVYSDVNGRRGDDMVKAVNLSDIERLIVTLSEGMAESEIRIKNLLSLASDIKEWEFAKKKVDGQ